jgi:drug/metabolite transporter (DMT)-like permease
VKNTSNNLFVGYILLFVQPIFMASNTIVARGGVLHVPPISLAFFRWLFVFLILFFFTREDILNNLKFIKKDLKKFIFLGLTGCGVCGAFPFLAGMTTTAANIGIIYTSSPIFIILFSFFIFKEKIYKLQLIGLTACLLGVIIIIIKGKLNLLLTLSLTKGDIWILGAALAWALYSIFLLKWKSKFNFYSRLTIIAFFGFLSLTPFALFENYFIKEIIFDKYFYFWTFFAALSPGIVAYILHEKLQTKLGASTSGFIIYLFAIYGSIYGILIFNEKLELFHYLGASLVFFGVFLARKKSIN